MKVLRQKSMFAAAILNEGVVGITLDCHGQPLMYMYLCMVSICVIIVTTLISADACTVIM